MKNRTDKTFATRFNNKGFNDKIVSVFLYCGAGAELDEFILDEPTSDAEYAMEQVAVDLLSDDRNKGFYEEIDSDRVKELEEEDEGIFEETLMYVDATMIGADRPIYIDMAYHIKFGYKD